MEGILAVVSHPDDETFGCGGSLTLHSDNAKVLCLTCDPIERKFELEEACKCLSISEPIIFTEDNVVPSRDLIRRISDVIVFERPKILITHLPFDYHLDHRATYSVVKEAIEWAAHTTIYKDPCLVERLLLMEINTLIPSPHVFVDISNVIDRKRAAVEVYDTQLEKFSWGYYEKFNEKKSELRGVQSNCNYAEAFIEEQLVKNGPFYETKVTSSLLR